jgi:hypothetical protein
MAKQVIGDACAYIPSVGGSKTRYLKIGLAMKDGDKLSIKIDTLPLSGTGWEGWINVFPQTSRSNDTSKLPVPKFAGPDFDDDIPF